MSLEYVQRFIGMDGKLRVVVDPSDPATVEAAAKAMYEHKMDCDGPEFSDLTDASRRYWQVGACAVLAAIAADQDALYQAMVNDGVIDPTVGDV